MQPDYITPVLPTIRREYETAIRKWQLAAALATLTAAILAAALLLVLA